MGKLCRVMVAMAMCLGGVQFVDTPYVRTHVDV